MAKQTRPIRWRKRDTELLQRKIANFNAKIYRTKKNHPEIADIQPDRIKKGEIMNSIKTRDDFNRVIAELESYSRRGAEKKAPSSRGRRTTVWEDKKYRKKQQEANRKKKKELQRLGELDVKSRGKPTGSKRSEMGKVWENDLKPSNRNPENMSQKEWEYFKRAMDSALDEMQSELGKHHMRLNYIQGLRNMGCSEDIIALVLEMPIDKFVDTVKLDTEATFEFIYDPIEFQAKQEALYEVWERALEESQ